MRRAALTGRRDRSTLVSIAVNRCARDKSGRVGAVVTSRETRRILAVSSGGGHWVQLVRLSPAFRGHDLRFACVSRAYARQTPGLPFYVLPDASRWSKIRLAMLGLRCVLLILRTRPDVVVTTGAAPGLLCVVLGKLFGARTIWVDSIANADEMSLSGRIARRFCDVWLTQWPHLEDTSGPWYWGSLL